MKSTSPQKDDHVRSDLNVDRDIEASIKPEPTASKSEESEYPHGFALALILIAVYLSMFLVALDRTILATAIPRITDDFGSLDDIGWYSSAYMLANCATSLLYGRIYKFYNTKWVLLISIGIFEVGSALCGAAPTSISFIIGRAIAGFGAAGIFTGGMMTMFHTVPLHKRPVYNGLFGAMFGLASVIAPLVGGVLTTETTWRWCFFINLPVGALAILIILLILKVPHPKETRTTFRQQIVQLDPLGTACFATSIVCLILALQWGGTLYAWSSWRIVLLLTIFAILLVVFVSLQFYKGDSGSLPPNIFLQRSVGAGALFTFCVAGGMMLVVGYLPIWFQAIQGVNAIQSGIRFLPTIISLVVSGILVGKIIAVVGYYVPSMVAVSVFTSIGAGLMTTLNQSSSEGMWIGYQVLVGFGLGCGMQSASLAVQTVLPKGDVSTGTAVIFFAQQLGGAIFVSVGQNLFINDLTSGLEDIPGLSTSAILNAGATELQRLVPTEYLEQVLVVYNHALTRTFVIAAAMMAVSVLAAVAMEWRSIKKSPKNVPDTSSSTNNEVDSTQGGEEESKT